MSLRKRLEKFAADTDRIIADVKFIRARRPEAGAQFAPDTVASAYTLRKWARDAIAALDAGEPLPPMPDVD